MSENESNFIDVLMISHNRPDYLRKSLPALLDSADDRTRIWLWQNGSDEKTLNVWREFVDHPKVYRHHHSVENKILREPTLWLWENSDGWLVGKVDDDCIVSPGWIEKISDLHSEIPNAGVVGSWHFLQEDFDLSLATPKIIELEHGHKMLQNCWVGGSAYLVKRSIVVSAGMLAENKGFSDFCYRVAEMGYINGWIYPLILQDHMDDPRSPNTSIVSDSALTSSRPLSAQNKDYEDVGAWLKQIKYNARIVQTAPTDPKYYTSRFWRTVKRLKEKFGLPIS